MDPLLRNRKPLAEIVLSHYLRNALLPILTVELVLVACYFGVNSWIRAESARALRSEVDQVLPHIARLEASRLQESFERISRETALLAREHEEVLAAPARIALRGPAPEFERAANGTWFQSNRTTHSSWYAPRGHRMDARERAEAVATASLDPLYEHMVSDIPNVVAAYFNSSDNTNRLHPFIHKVWEQYPPDIRMADYNFYYLADSSHDPAGRPVWTGAYLDPAGQGWMVSCVAPVRSRRGLRGVVGLDVTTERIVRNLLGREYPWKSAVFLVDDSGTILAMPEPVEELFGLKELKAHVYDSTVDREHLKPRDYNLLANPDPTVAGRFRELLRTGAPEAVLQVRGRTSFLAQARIPETGWRVFVVARSQDVLAAVDDAARKTRIVGGWVVVGMAFFYAVFFTYLRRNARRMAQGISRPISELAEAASRLGTSGSTSTGLQSSGIQEIDALTSRFDELAHDLGQRSAELVESRVRERMKEKESELAFARGQYESASGYLHNVGNLAVRLGSTAMDLRQLAESGRQYPEVFRRIRAGSDPELVDRLEEVLLDRTFPRLEECAVELEDVRSGIRNAIEHQQRSFLEGGEEGPEPEAFDLSECVERTCAEFAEWSDPVAVALRTDVEPGIVVRHHRHQIKSGIVNAVKNAFESVGPGPGTVEVSLARDSATGRAVIRVKDDGRGIAPDHLPRILTAGFTTKPWGHGLGLHSLAVFLSSRNGNVELRSEGPGKGALLTIEVGDA